MALPFGDAVLAVFGANTQPMTVARFAAGAAPLVREYPVADLSALFAEAGPREKAGDFDASSDLHSRILADRPRQLVAVAGVPWLVRGAATPASIPRAWRSSPPPAPASGGCCRCPATRSSPAPAPSTRQRRLPALHTRAARAARRPHLPHPDRPHPKQRLDRRGERPSPPADPATAFTDGVGKLRVSGASSVHALSAAVLAGEVVIYSRELHRSGSSRPALLAMDLARAEVTRHVPVQHEDPFRVAVTGGALLGLGAKSIVRIAPASLTIVDSADLPAGVRLLGHDETRLVILHKRSKSLLVLDAAPFAGELAAAMDGVAAVLAAKPEKARKKG